MATSNIGKHSAYPIVDQVTETTRFEVLHEGKNMSALPAHIKAFFDVKDGESFSFVDTIDATDEADAISKLPAAADAKANEGYVCRWDDASYLFSFVEGAWKNLGLAGGTGKPGEDGEPGRTPEAFGSISAGDEAEALDALAALTAQEGDFAFVTIVRDVVMFKRAETDWAKEGVVLTIPEVQDGEDGEPAHFGGQIAGASIEDIVAGLPAAADNATTFYLGKVEGSVYFIGVVDGAWNPGSEPMFVAPEDGTGRTPKSHGTLTGETEQDVLDQLNAIASALEGDYAFGRIKGVVYSFARGAADWSQTGEMVKDGKSAYEVWTEIPGNESKTPEQFIEAITGKSAYEIAVELGFEGTEQEWLDQLAIGGVTAEFLQGIFSTNQFSFFKTLRVMPDATGISAMDAKTAWHRFLFLFDPESTIHTNQLGDPQLMSEAGRVGLGVNEVGFTYLKNTNAANTDKSLPEPEGSEIRIYDDGVFHIGDDANNLRFSVKANTLTITKDGVAQDPIDLTDLGPGKDGHSPVVHPTIDASTPEEAKDVLDALLNAKENDIAFARIGNDLYLFIRNELEWNDGALVIEGNGGGGTDGRTPVMVGSVAGADETEVLNALEALTALKGDWGLGRIGETGTFVFTFDGTGWTNKGLVVKDGDQGQIGRTPVHTGVFEGADSDEIKTKLDALNYAYIGDFATGRNTTDKTSSIWSMTATGWVDQGVFARDGKDAEAGSGRTPKNLGVFEADTEQEIFDLLFGVASAEQGDFATGRIIPNKAAYSFVLRETGWENDGMMVKDGEDGTDATGTPGHTPVNMGTIEGATEQEIQDGLGAITGAVVGDYAQGRRTDVGETTSYYFDGADWIAKGVIVKDGTAGTQGRTPVARGTVEGADDAEILTALQAITNAVEGDTASGRNTATNETHGYYLASAGWEKQGLIAKDGAPGQAGKPAQFGGERTGADMASILSEIETEAPAAQNQGLFFVGIVDDEHFMINNVADTWTAGSVPFSKKGQDGQDGKSASFGQPITGTDQTDAESQLPEVATAPANVSYYLSWGDGQYLYSIVGGQWVNMGKFSGEDGAKGDNGKSLTSGNGAPAESAGAEGDTYIDLDTGNIYTKGPAGQSPTLWTITGAIKGGVELPENAQTGDQFILTTQGPKLLDKVDYAVVTLNSGAIVADDGQTFSLNLTEDTTFSITAPSRTARRRTLVLEVVGSGAMTSWDSTLIEFGESGPPEFGQNQTVITFYWNGSKWLLSGVVKV